MLPLTQVKTELKTLRSRNDEAAATEKLLREQLLAQAAEAEAEREELEKELQTLRRSAASVSTEVVAKSRQDMDKLREKLAEEVRAREEVEDRSQKLHTRVLALQADLEIARAERKELESLVNTLRVQGLEGTRGTGTREALGVRSANDNAYASPGALPEKASQLRSPAAHLFMAGSLSGTPGKVAKILLGSSERHRLATADYLASLLEGTSEINRVGKGLLPEDMADIAAYVKTHPRIERLFLSGNSLGLAGAKQLCSLLLDPSLRLQRLDLRHNNLGNR